MAAGQSVYDFLPTPRQTFWRWKEIVNLAPHHQTANIMQPPEMTSELTEFDFGYYGWSVVLAACLGVMAEFARYLFIPSPFL